MRIIRRVITLTPSTAEVEQVVPRPIPASDAMPSWWNDITPFSHRQSNAMVSTEPTRQPSVKKCVPFADALRFGYVQELWCDVLIETDEHGTRYEWAAGPQPLEIRDNAASLMPIPDGYKSIEFAWLQPWYVSTPKTHTLLVTQPMNRFDLPFVCTSGVVDNSSTFRIPFGRIPFFVKDGFNGIIPAGTPMFQIIPIKIEDWGRIDDHRDNTEVNRLAFKVNRVFTDWYRKYAWHRKTFR